MVARQRPFILMQVSGPTSILESVPNIRSQSEVVLEHYYSAAQKLLICELLGSILVIVESKSRRGECAL